jgi:hypothetical protein
VTHHVPPAAALLQAANTAARLSSAAADLARLKSAAAAKEQELGGAVAQLQVRACVGYVGDCVWVGCGA